jgi:three-Cys-motif partner protein
MTADNFLRGLADDGHYLPLIKAHSLGKIQRHNYYAELFATSMRKKWPQLAYVGLYSGAGRARIENTGEIIETTAISAVRLPVPFDKYIFVDSDLECTQALAARIAAASPECDAAVLPGDVREIAPLVRHALPTFGPGNGLLSFCFVDPFAADLRFDTIRALSSFRMDFLVLLMLGWDARVNFRRYYDDHTSTRLGDLIDSPAWREEYRRATDKHVVRFLLRKFDEAMVRLGYLPAAEDHYHRVTAVGKGVLQYVLVLYTKHPLGQQFWKQALAGSADQLGFELR